MDYFDEEIIESKKQRRREQYTTLDTGVYVDDELITFSLRDIPETDNEIYIPDQFVDMPVEIKNMKYPSKEAPEWIVTSLDTTVNFCFNVLPISLEADSIRVLGNQFESAIKSINPAIKTKTIDKTKTEYGYDIYGFEYVGFTLDGQSYNQVFVIRFKNHVIHSVFNCAVNEKEEWTKVADLCIYSIRDKKD